MPRPFQVYLDTPNYPTASLTLTYRGLLTRRRGRCDTSALNRSFSDTPDVAAKFIRMTHIVAVTVQYTSARIGLHQQAIRQTSFAEHPAVRLTFLVSTNVTTRHIRIDTVAVLPPGSGALDPVAGLDRRCQRRPAYPWPRRTVRPMP